MTQSLDRISGCAAVNDHINKPIPSVLWHYTSYAAFQGIISSKQIWATEYRFLNDHEEFIHSKALANQVLEDVPEFTGSKFPARERLQHFVTMAFNTGYLHKSRLIVMVASFSEEGDQLGQWRGYADNSTGVSIGFDLRDIRRPLDLGGIVTFAPCLYKEADKRALLKAVIVHYMDKLQRWWDSMMEINVEKKSKSSTSQGQKGYESEQKKVLSDLVNRCYEDLQSDLLRIALLLKNESFSEEKEWRLVLPWEAIMLPMNHPIKFRPSRDVLVPHIAYPLNRPNQKGPVFCNDLILGPGSHPSAEIGVNMFLQTQQIQVLARASKIPYRPT